MQIFQGRHLAIATMHGKESVIASRVASSLGVIPLVPQGLNTDQLGTFTGEVERITDPLTTARKKCEMALDMTGYDLAIANEGSFGMHPLLSFVPSDEELILLLDRKHDFEIVGRQFSTKTNFGGQLCETTKDLLDFADRVKFPLHALILRSAKKSEPRFFKGIRDKDELLDKFRFLNERYGQAFVETDMRAMYNPMRMDVIAEATEVMLDKAVTACEACNFPGFGISDVKSGLRCRQCNLPTRSIQAYIYSCPKCHFFKELSDPHKSFEEPMYCDFCNP
ncbi:hypothetical protein JMN32_18145 [Fulvivirga sp. 29W222]|uniref:DUF6671 domain-containing protein n=1 Tax=Fulvivirga marina TaxID=2494733 RepID=A0A937G4E7_9BACT|nr:DUF6671 family protein [Fulvivirga marina]MBL6448241.1 hypothetical protein [Fulvivirga marina]